MLRQDEGEATAFLRAMELRRNLYTDVTLDTGTVPSGGYWAVFLGPLIESKKKAREYRDLAFVTFSFTGDPGLQPGYINTFCSLCVGYSCILGPTPIPNCKAATVWEIRRNKQKGNSGDMAVGRMDQTFACEPEF